MDMELVWEQNGIAILYEADRVTCKQYQAGTNIFNPLLLEVRIFNPNEEYRAVRNSLADEQFFTRVLTDENAPYEDSHEEIHFLDIAQGPIACNEPNDEEAYRYITTGGGAFVLPCKANKIVVKSYLHYNSKNGLAEIGDWRIVSFRNEATEEKGAVEWLNL